MIFPIQIRARAYEGSTTVKQLSDRCFASLQNTHGRLENKNLGDDKLKIAEKAVII
jgi:hypothetical protein